MIGILSSIIVIANVSYAKENTKLNEISIKTEYIKEVYLGIKSKKTSCEECNDLKENYDTLFKNAEKYVPGISQKGEQIYLERNNLKTELGVALKKQREDNNSKIKEEIKNEIIFIRELVSNGKITKREGERQLKKNRERYKKNIRNFREEYKTKHKKEIKTRLLQKEKTKKAFNEFVNAVESGDAISVEKTFNNYFENSKILNDMLKQYLSDVKAGI